MVPEDYPLFLADGNQFKNAGAARKTCMAGFAARTLSDSGAQKEAAEEVCLPGD